MTIDAASELEFRLRELAILHELSGLPVRSPCAEHLCRAAAERATRTLHSQVAVVLWREAMSQEWQATASVGQGCQEVLPGLQNPNLHLLLAPTTGVSVTQDAQILNALFPRAHAREAVIVPAQVGSLGYVILCAGRVTSDPFLPDHQRLYRVLAGSLGVLLENLLLREEMRTAATTDALTRLHNRRQFYADVEQRVQRFRSQGTPFGLMLLDLRRFKDVNDRYGHTRGDALLRDFADVLAKHASPYGRAYRYGGDEFVILFSGKSRSLSQTLANEITEASRNLVRRSDTQESLLIVDIGTSVCPDDGISAEELIHSADLRMYAVKYA